MTSGPSLGTGQFDISANLKPFDSAIANLTGQIKRLVANAINIPVGIKSAIPMQAIGSVANGIRSATSQTRGLYAALSTAAVVAAGIGVTRKAIQGASDLEETLQKIGVVFGDSASIVASGSEVMAKKFGIVKNVYLDAAASLGLIGKAAGMSQTEAAGLADKLAKLAVDASSFYNVHLDEALIAMRAGLVGESEPLRRFGVLLNEATVANEAVKIGLSSTTKNLTEGMKVQARASLITKGLADATGDLARTSDSYANRSRAIAGRWTNMLSRFGQSIMPVAAEIQNLMERTLGRLGTYLEENAVYIAAWARGMASKLSLLSQLWSNWREFARIAILFVKQSMMQMVEVILRVGEFIKRAAQGAWDYLVFGAQTAIKVMQNLFVGFSQFLVDLFSSLGDNLAATLQGALIDFANSGITKFLTNVPGMAPLAAMLNVAGKLQKPPVPGIKANLAGLNMNALKANLPAAPGAPGGANGFGGLFNGLFGALPNLNREIGAVVDKLHQLNAAEALGGFLGRLKATIQAIPRRVPVTAIERLNADNRRRGLNRPLIVAGPRNRGAQEQAARVLRFRAEQDDRDARRGLGINFGIRGRLGAAAAKAAEELAKKAGLGDAAAKAAGLAAAGVAGGVAGVAGAQQAARRRLVAPRRRRGGPMMPDFDTSDQKVEYINLSEMQKHIQAGLQSGQDKQTKTETMLGTLVGAIGADGAGGTVRGLLTQIRDKRPGAGVAV